MAVVIFFRLVGQCVRKHEKHGDHQAHQSREKQGLVKRGELPYITNTMEDAFLGMPHDRNEKRYKTSVERGKCEVHEKPPRLSRDNGSEEQEAYEGEHKRCDEKRVVCNAVIEEKIRRNPSQGTEECARKSSPVPHELLASGFLIEDIYYPPP